MSIAKTAAAVIVSASASATVWSAGVTAQEPRTATRANAPATMTEGERALDYFLTGTRTLAGDFTQVQIDEDGVILDQSSGRFYLNRPGQFHWHYSAPFEQQVISDGNTLWHYDTDLAQVLERTVDQAVTASPAVLLTGGNYGDAFNVVSLSSDNPDLQYVALQPKSGQTDFESATLAFAGSVPATLEIVDALGSTTRLQFENVVQNVVLKPELFSFSAPDGVDVIRAEESL